MVGHVVNGAPAQGVSAGLLARWTHACRMAKFWVTCLDALALPGQCRCAECAPGWLAAHQTSSAHGAVTSGVAFDGVPEPAVTAGVFAPSAAQLGALFRSAGKGNLKHANSDCCNTGCLRKRDPKSARMTATAPNSSLRVRNSAKRRGSYLLSAPARVDFAKLHCSGRDRQRTQTGHWVSAVGPRRPARTHPGETTLG